MSQFLCDLDRECSENDFDDNETFPREENSMKNDIIDRGKMGPKSVKKHGLYPMVLADFGPHFDVPIFSSFGQKML